jgi:hypothetical protein
MTFNTAEVISSRFGDSPCSASHGINEITIDLENAGLKLPDHYAVIEPSEEAPLYRVVYREAFGYHLEPVERPEGMIGPMGDGKYARIPYRLKQLLSEKAGYPVTEVLPIHDRFETPEMYERLSR